MQKLLLIFLSVLLGAEAYGEHYCASCHKGKIKLSSLKSKQEWERLTSDGGKMLEVIHKKKLSVVSYLNSKEYSEKKLYETVSFFSRDEKSIQDRSHEKQVEKKYTFQKPKLTFEYMGFDINKTQGGVLMELLETSIRKHGIKDKTVIQVHVGEWKTDPGNAFMFIMTMGMAPVIYKQTITMQLKIAKKNYISEKVRKKENGVLSGVGDTSAMKKAIKDLLDDVIKKQSHKK